MSQSAATSPSSSPQAPGKTLSDIRMGPRPTPSASSSGLIAFGRSRRRCASCNSAGLSLHRPINRNNQCQYYPMMVRHITCNTIGALIIRIGFGMHYTILTIRIPRNSLFYCLSPLFKFVLAPAEIRVAAASHWVVRIACMSGVLPCWCWEFSS